MSTNDSRSLLTLKQQSIINRDSQQCKLLGRSAEESILLNAYFASLSSISISSEVPAAVVLICGESGQGKTKLALTLRQTVLEDDGFFIRGKFDQNISCHGSSLSTATANLPYSAISSALGEYCSQLEQRGGDDWNEVADAMKREIRKDEGELLCEAIPALSKLLHCGDQSLYESFRRSATREENGEDEGNNFSECRSHRLNYLLKKFVRVIAKIGEPVVFLIDDMQWADASSLDILRALVLGATNPFTFIFTYRPVDEGHPFCKMLGDFSSSSMRITEISLSSLKKNIVHDLVINILRLDQSSSSSSHLDCETLSSFIFHATNGNPFFIRQQILSLCDNGLLWYAENHWEWDIERIKQSSVLDDIVSIIHGKMKGLPHAVQEVLVICACIGSTTNFRILQILAGSNTYLSQNVEEETNVRTEIAVSIACEEGLLVRTKDGTGIHFFHDSIQSAAYSLLEEDRRAAFHLDLGRKLRQHLCPNESNIYLFTIASQLARGQELISEVDEQIAVARIFLQAGTVSRLASASTDAHFFISRGIRLLRDDDWNHNYTLCRDLYMKGAEVAAHTRNYEDLDGWLDIILEKSKNSVDTQFQAYWIQVTALNARQNIVAAVDRGVEALRLVGITFPSNCLAAHTLWELARTRSLLRGKDLHDLAPIKNVNIIPALRLLDLLCTLSVGANPKMIPLFSLKTLQLNLKYGLSVVLPTALSNYAYILGRIGFPLSESAKYAEISLSIQDHMWKSSNGRPETMASVTMINYGTTFSFTKSLHDCLEPLLDGFSAGLQSGDVFNAFVCYQFYGWFSFHSGQELNKLLALLKKIAQTFEEWGSNKTAQVTKAYQQAVVNFLGVEGVSTCPASLQGNIFDFDAVFSELDWAKKNMMLYNQAQLMQLMTSCFYGHYEVAWAMSEELQDFGKSFTGLIFQYICAFYRGLTALSLLQVANKKKYVSTIKSSLKVLRSGQKKSPINLSHRLFVLEAEYSAFKKKYSKAEKFFSLAIEHASKLKVLHELALAHERLGQYHIMRNNQEDAIEQFELAHKVYSQWGSVPKCQMIKKKISSFKKK